MCISIDPPMAALSGLSRHKQVYTERNQIILASAGFLSHNPIAPTYRIEKEREDQP
jgi:hypothetical protein